MNRKQQPQQLEGVEPTEDDTEAKAFRLYIRMYTTEKKWEQIG